jgi:hypothetical protein
VLFAHSANLERVHSRFSRIAANHPEATPLLLGVPTNSKIRLGDAGLAAALDAYLFSIRSLYESIAFAAGPAGGRVADAHRHVTAAIAATRRIGEERVGKR